MKLRALMFIFCLVLLTGCNALSGRCDYIPPDDCGCRTCDLSLWSDCKRYRSIPQNYIPEHCGNEICKGGSCGQSWSCGRAYPFHDL